MKKNRTNQKFWSKIRKQDGQNYADDETLFDWYLLRLIGIYAAITVAIAIYYSKTLALTLIAILFTPVIIILIILFLSKR
ncbi:MAG: hypothetical protein IKN09_00060 [Clostridia bacterium]|nr:hypothetical protein [Clostridia bacterium]MBR4261707.1 hypothetical protein [Clostridia bacterium]